MLIEQVEQRISTQGKVIQQGSEGLCGLVSLENVLILSQPERFKDVIADLFCLASTERFKEHVTVGRSTLECKKSSSKKDKDILFNMQEDGKIFEVDFIFGGSLGLWGNSVYQICADVSGQGQGVVHETTLARQIFPEATVRVMGGQTREAINGITNLGIGWHSTHLSKGEWNQALDVVRHGGQALISMNTAVKTAKGLHTNSDHWVTLTRVLDGDDIQDACASKILQEVPACIIWTWSSYYIFENCDNLRKISDSAVLLDLHNGQKTGGPKEFLPDSEGLQKVTNWIRLLHGYRHSGELTDISGSKYSYLTGAHWLGRNFIAASGEKTYLVPNVPLGTKQNKLKYKGATYKYHDECLGLYESKSYEWWQVMKMVHDGGKAVIDLDYGNPNNRNEFPANFAILIRILNGSGVASPCTRKLLQETPACVIWNPWHETHYVFESCQNLQMLSSDRGAIPLAEAGAEIRTGQRVVFGTGPFTYEQLEAMYKEKTPEQWKSAGGGVDQAPDSQDFSLEMENESLVWIRSMHMYRHTGQLAPGVKSESGEWYPELAYLTVDGWGRAFPIEKDEKRTLLFMPAIPMRGQDVDYKAATFTHHAECINDLY